MATSILYYWRLVVSVPFLAPFVLGFIVAFGVFFLVGFVPSYVDGTTSDVKYSVGTIEPGRVYAAGSIETSVSLARLPILGEETSPAAAPTRIIARSIGLDLPVANPSSTDVAVLDKALTTATVRYPSSGLLGQKGNVLVFGHSSRLPVVYNPLYKAFNRISELKAGAIVSLEGNGLLYNYQVTTIRRADASEDYIDIATDKGARLTLLTCDTFGKKSARWVVEAIFVDTTKVPGL